MGGVFYTGKKVCYGCGSDKSTMNKVGGFMRWIYNRNQKREFIGFLCHKCYMSILMNPKRRGNYNKKLLNYKDKNINVGFKPRKGICSWCTRKVGKGIKRTNLHHFAEYHDEDPLKDTVEICVSCHSYENWRLGLHDKQGPQPRDKITGRFIPLGKSCSSEE